MTTDLKTNISLGTSVLAMFLWAVNVYYTHYQPIQLEVAVGSELYIGNMIGGVPHVDFVASFRGNGPQEKALVLSTIEMSIKRISTGERYELISTQTSELPTIIQGKGIIQKSICMRPPDDIPGEMERVNSWFNMLIQALPSETSRIEELRSDWKQIFLPVQTFAEKYGKWKPTGDVMSGSIPFHGRVTLAKEMEEDNKRSFVNDSISMLLLRLPPEKIDRLLFFSGGSYNIEMKFFDENRTELTYRKYTLSINDVLSQVLRCHFDETSRVRLTQGEK